VVLPSELVSKLGRRIHRRVDVSPQPLLCVRQRSDDGGELDLADDDQVDVARGPQLAARGRTKDEGDQPPVRERRKGLAEDVGQPDGLGEDAPKLGEHRSVAIRLEIHLPALRRSLQESRGGQLPEFPLHRPEPRAGQPCDLAEVIGLVRVPEQPAEHSAAGSPEQHRGSVRPAVQVKLPRSHVGYERTRIGNNSQAEAIDRAGLILSAAAAGRIAPGCTSAFPYPQGNIRVFCSRMKRILAVDGQGASTGNRPVPGVLDHDGDVLRLCLERRVRRQATESSAPPGQSPEVRKSREARPRSRGPRRWERD